MGPLVTLCASEGPGSRPGKPHAIRAGEQVLLSTRTVTAGPDKMFRTLPDGPGQNSKST